ncbi:DNA-binding response regulator [Flavobacterium alvei]|uniref:DNA-binding response regulator n=1 Tax=Flavobacterium alvei TaxID=2080416 RepID=A0A2S5A7B5_9FLAO|nr:response regulator transcription factor [Flavobacterium alvei]POY38222.1 DNA-binding response regulator [Flavobacterium alvei]
MIKILIVEDNFFLQKALEEKLSNFSDIIIKDIAQNGEEALVILEKNHVVDLILMDIEMPKMNGIKATEIIKSKYPQIKIVIITVFDNDENIFNAIKAGADGYLLKETKAEKIYEAIGETLSGGAAMSPSIAMKTLKFLKNPVVFEDLETPEQIALSDREIEVLEQLSQGLKNQAIADNLFISFSTVKKHIENIYKKLQAHNRIELIQKAKQNKLL